MHRKSLRSLSSAQEKWGQKLKCCVYNFVQYIYLEQEVSYECSLGCDVGSFFFFFYSIPEITNFPIQLRMMCTLEIKGFVEISPNLWGHLKGCDPLMVNVRQLTSWCTDNEWGMALRWDWENVCMVYACKREKRKCVFASVRTGEVLTEWKKEGPQTLSRAREDEPGVKFGWSTPESPMQNMFLH